MMPRALRILFGLAGYGLGGLVTPALLVWIGGVVPWFAIDRALLPLPVTDAAAAAIDLGLIALFGVQHSLMAGPRVKAWLTRRLPPALERTAFVIATCTVVIAMVALWQPLGGTVWRVHAPTATVVWALGVAIVYGATLWLDHVHLLGLRQAWRGDTHASEPDRLKLDGPYRFVRHPLMTGLLVVFWATPHMTAGHLLFALAMTAYVLLGTYFEERKLRRQFGAAYDDFARWTPALVPRPWPTRDRTPRATPAVAARPRSIVRRPDLDSVTPEPAVWYGDNVVATAMMTAYSVLFPPLERFMTDELRAANREVGDPHLAARVRSFAGQEELHAREHERANAALAAMGYRIGLFDRLFRGIARWILRPSVARVARPYNGTPGVVAIFAGVEHWTATLAEIALAYRYPTRMYGSMFALYFWHAAEELEHKSVVADVFTHLRGNYLVRISMFLLSTLVFGLLTLAGTLYFLAQIPFLQGRRLGLLTYPFRVLHDGVRFLFVDEKMALKGLRAFFAYLRPGFHPDQRDTGALVDHALQLSRDAGAVL